LYADPAEWLPIRALAPKRLAEADCMRKHRDLEALKERQFANEQTTRLRQVQERMACVARV
jgi:hypothetical protein